MFVLQECSLGFGLVQPSLSRLSVSHPSLLSSSDAVLWCGLFERIIFVLIWFSLQLQPPRASMSLQHGTVQTVRTQEWRRLPGLSSQHRGQTLPLLQGRFVRSEIILPLLRHFYKHVSYFPGYFRDQSKPITHRKACKRKVLFWESSKFFNLFFFHCFAETACDCHPVGSSGRTCNITTGQCQCKPGVTGLACNRCAKVLWQKSCSNWLTNFFFVIDHPGLSTISVHHSTVHKWVLKARKNSWF